MLFLMLFAGSALLFSCSKDSGSSSTNNSSCTLNSTSIVGTYKIIAATYQEDATSAPIDDFATWELCQKDNLLIINSNGTYVFSEGTLSCNPSDVETGTWVLNGNALVTTTSGTTISDYQTLSDFNCTTFKLTDILDPTTGETGVLTFQRQ